MGINLILITSWLIWIWLFKRNSDNVRGIETAYQQGEVDKEIYTDGRKLAYTQRRFVLLAGIFLVVFNVIILFI